MLLPPLDGSFHTRLTLVAAGQEELQESLCGDEDYGNDENRGFAQTRSPSTEKRRVRQRSRGLERRGHHAHLGRCSFLGTAPKRTAP